MNTGIKCNGDICSSNKKKYVLISLIISKDFKKKVTRKNTVGHFVDLSVTYVCFYVKIMLPMSSELRYSMLS